MGYQIVFKTKNLPKEVFEKYESNLKNHYSEDKLDKMIFSTKLELIIYLCHLHKNDSTDSNFNYYNLERLINKINYYKYLLEEKWKLEFSERLNNNEEIWYCGWEYANSSTIEDEDFIKNIIESLIIFSYNTEKVDSIENAEYFYNKYNTINDKLLSIEESVYDYYSHQFVDKYRDYQEKYDDEEDENTETNIDSNVSSDSNEEPDINHTENN